MHGLYNFVRGPLAWTAFAIFVVGFLYRLISIILLTKKKDGVVFEYVNLYYSLRSMFHWLLPFGAGA